MSKEPQVSAREGLAIVVGEDTEATRVLGVVGLTKRLPMFAAEREAAQTVADDATRRHDDAIAEQDTRRRDAAPASHDWTAAVPEVARRRPSVRGFGLVGHGCGTMR